MRISFVFAVVVAGCVLIPQVAKADCVMVPYRFTLGIDTSTSETSSGGPCRRYFYADTYTVYDSLSVVSRPSHGTVSVSGTSASYTPKAGYKGPDTYALKLCGHGRSRGGRISCTVITYSTTML